MNPARPVLHPRRRTTAVALLAALTIDAATARWRRDIADHSLTDILLSRNGHLSETDRQTLVAESQRAFGYEDLLDTVIAADLPSVYAQLDSSASGDDGAPPADPSGGPR